MTEMMTERERRELAEALRRSRVDFRRDKVRREKQDHSDLLLAAACSWCTMRREERQLEKALAESKLSEERRVAVFAAHDARYT